MCLYLLSLPFLSQLIEPSVRHEMRYKYPLLSLTRESSSSPVGHVCKYALVIHSCHDNASASAPEYHSLCNNGGIDHRFRRKPEDKAVEATIYSLIFILLTSRIYTTTFHFLHFNYKTRIFFSFVSYSFLSTLYTQVSRVSLTICVSYNTTCLKY